MFLIGILRTKPKYCLDLNQKVFDITVKRLNIIKWVPHHINTPLD